MFQPFFHSGYFYSRTSQSPKGVKQLNYLSFEDALWDLLARKVSPGSVVLVPEFFCPDVEANIRSHGYQVGYYPLDANLQTKPSELLSAVKQTKAQVVIILHPVGITNRLWQEPSWLKSLPDSILVIEDCVHRVVDLEEIEIQRKNHYLIDSWRKVVPLQGAGLYGSVEDLNFTPPPLTQALGYSLKVHTWWVAMLVTWWLAGKNTRLLHLAERLMIKGYDLIGDSQKPAPAWGVLAWAQHHLNHNQIKKVKDQQMRLYEQQLSSIVSKVGWVVEYLPSDRGQLRGWPVVLDSAFADHVLTKLRQSGVVVRFELVGCKWSESNKIIYLPLGVHLSKASQAWVIDVFRRVAEEASVN